MARRRACSASVTDWQTVRNVCRFFIQVNMPDELKVNISAQPTMESLALKYALSPREIQQIGTSAINRSLPTIRSSIGRTLAAEIN